MDLCSKQYKISMMKIGAIIVRRGSLAGGDEDVDMRCQKTPKSAQIEVTV